MELTAYQLFTTWTISGRPFFVGYPRLQDLGDVAPGSLRVFCTATAGMTRKGGIVTHREKRAAARDGLGDGPAKECP